jgi:hypothetical protein
MTWSLNSYPDEVMQADSCDLYYDFTNNNDLITA